MKTFICSSLVCLVWLTAASVRAQDVIPVAPPPPPNVLVAPTLRPAQTTASTPAPGATPEAETEFDDHDTVRVSTNLITVPAEVMDRSGRYIGNLRKQDFRVFENGVEQDLAYFASVEQPFTVALLLDVSGSTKTRLQAIRSAANAFIKGLRPNDRLLLVSFDGKINVLTEAVTLNDLRKKKLRLDALNDGTLLYDTVSFVLNQRLAGIPGRRAIVLLTDGVDGGSKKGSYKQTLRDVEEADVVIYTVQYNTLPDLPARLSQIMNPKARAHTQARMLKEYAVGSTYLEALARKTGGRLQKAESLADVPQAFAAITEELGRQYSLGYYPKGQVQAGEKRDIKVRTRSANFVVRARQSYVAAAPASRNGGQD
ncbi:MAG: VWA domain-containing protein [Pyrinomonadaceae bacterium]|nr:VWA domain-containing protein [Pyrinomonadaceae bacterium]